MEITSIIRVFLSDFREGGEWSPPHGGDLRGGLGPEGGGMARDSVATNKLINNVYKRGLSWI